MLAKKLADEGTAWTPVFINLPSLKDPVTNLQEHLQNLRFSETEIAALQQEKLLFIMDGYDELRNYKNLYQLNGLSKWNVKIVITCRS